MRFAWLQKNSANQGSTEPSFANRLTFVAYNVVWWIPVVLPFTKVIDYRTGFIAFFVATVIRAGANLYRNNVLTTEQGVSFPFRSP